MSTTSHIYLTETGADTVSFLGGWVSWHHARGWQAAPPLLCLPCTPPPSPRSFCSSRPSGTGSRGFVAVAVDCCALTCSFALSSRLLPTVDLEWARLGRAPWTNGSLASARHGLGPWLRWRCRPSRCYNI
eukprot:6240057-Amphidinium_carterae.1